MHIKDMIEETERSGAPSFSFEYFPPKTMTGIANLYDRMDRMAQLGPKFIDITWGAGGRVAELTCDIVNQVQAYIGVETCMHLTCTDMGEEKVNEALNKAYKAGCTNILALRGDPPRETEKWEAAEDGFNYARDLVKHIRKLYGNHFSIGVAGYPEGCDDNKDEELLLDHLKEKCDAGASFIVTQMFYDVDNFLRWVSKVRGRGIDIPIIPGIMPIATYASFLRRANHMNAKIPDKWMKVLEPIKNDDLAVRELGTTLVANMCRKIFEGGIVHMHFYTMNLAQATRMVLEELDWKPSPRSPLQPSLPWKQSLALGRRNEDVRPVFWRNRNKSYISRTMDWDEFPNGRWGDSRSPAFGELDAYGTGLSGTNAENRKKWGEPKSFKDVSEVFVKYLNREVDSLPWSESPLTGEASDIQNDLVDLNKRGLMTINSQPAVNGAKSTDPVHGWGPKSGFVYQKAYVELFVSPDVYPKLISRIKDHPDLTYYAVTKAGDFQTNTLSEGPNAVTWGVFPGKEIVQPTIVESISFLAWKDEAYQLGVDWAKCFDAESPSRILLNRMMTEWRLVNIGKSSLYNSDSRMNH